MNSDSIPISQSKYSNHGFVPSVRVLTVDNSNEFWRNHIDADSEHYFEIPFGTWLSEGRKRIYDDWVTDFNIDDSNSLKEALSLLGWNLEDPIYFAWHRTCSFKTCWKEFLVNWITYLQFEDDCPIVYNLNGESYEFRAVVFSPRGMVFAHQKPPENNKL